MSGGVGGGSREVSPYPDFGKWERKDTPRIINKNQCLQLSSALRRASEKSMTFCVRSRVTTSACIQVSTPRA